MRLFINALGASAGGGLTYLRNVVPHIAAHPDVEVPLLVSRDARTLIPAASNVLVIDPGENAHDNFSRFFWEQRQVPALIRQTGADVLLSAGNFAIWKSPVPQILLSRNSLYTSLDFAHDLQRRRDYRLWVDTRLKGLLARKSVQRAELTIAPSEAFARELSAWAGRDVIAVHHGFDRSAFFRDDGPLPLTIQEKLKETEGAVRLLFVSHYNYYRNFETLLRGIALLKARYPFRQVRLLLTCELVPGKNPGSYSTREASTLLRELRISSDVVQLGPVPYALLHQVYRSCQIYVTPAYTETFAHPLVEAMASGLPIVASDLPVHREITGGAALFFDRFSPTELADKVAQLLASPQQQSDLQKRGLAQSENFSWKVHVQRLLELIAPLCEKR